VPGVRKNNRGRTSKCARALDIPEDGLDYLERELGRKVLMTIVNFRHAATQTINGLLEDFPELITCLSVNPTQRKSFHELLKIFVSRALHQKIERVNHC
jgi:hypothetical protein